MTTLLILIIVTMIIMTLSNSLGLGYIEVQYFDINIKKPDWCNFTSLIDYYYIFTELQNKFKYPCAQYVWTKIKSKFEFYNLFG
jgi:hypothetical protein